MRLPRLPRRDSAPRSRGLRRGVHHRAGLRLHGRNPVPTQPSGRRTLWGSAVYLALRPQTDRDKDARDEDHPRYAEAGDRAPLRAAVTTSYMLVGARYIVPLRAYKIGEEMRLSRIETFMLGRILMYDLNAVTDAHIADAIIRHLKRGELLLEGGEVGTRAENFIRLAEQFDPPGEHLLSIAYTLGHLNGMADHIYARVAERRIFTERGKPIGEFLAQHTPTRQTAPYDYQGGREKVSNVMALAQIIWRGRVDAP